VSITDIIWPWGALRDARRAFARAVADYEGERSLGREALRSARAEVDDARLALASEQLRRRNSDAEIDRLRAIINGGHFRNPKTGRLGRRGETF
jgi:hypothetical protein